MARAIVCVHALPGLYGENTLTPSTQMPIDFNLYKDGSTHPSRLALVTHAPMGVGQVALASSSSTDVVPMAPVATGRRGGSSIAPPSGGTPLPTLDEAPTEAEPAEVGYGGEQDDMQVDGELAAQPNVDIAPA